MYDDHRGHLLAPSDQSLRGDHRAIGAYRLGDDVGTCRDGRLESLLQRAP
jgi:hypothetical protein